MTNTTSEFGKELDSLADAITFGVAPSLLALIWGFHFLPDSINPQLRLDLQHAGAFICFLFLIGGVSRLARFNISHDAQPRNPGRPGRKYFVGMPIPAAAGYQASTGSPHCI
jgi:CDP-diacylglycerol--serine O-phosphatidyltransferase